MGQHDFVGQSEFLLRAGLPYAGGGGGSFEWSEERARAIEAALSRLGPLPGARIIRELEELILQRGGGKEREQRLDAVEDWLRSQLPAWQSEAVGEGELVEVFNEGLSAGANGLKAALEVVDLLRAGESYQLMIAEQLLDQMDDCFQVARQRLLESEPYEDDEP